MEVVKTAQTGNRIQLFFMVIDTGIGIDKAAQDKLFQSFYQVDASISRRYGGTGLGLNICKQLIELMGGNIHVESTVGKGTIFTFDIWAEIAEEDKAYAEEDAGKEYTAELIEKDFFMDEWYQDLGTFDIVISNPPYIPSEDILILEPDVREYDPMMALDGGKDGLNAYRAISKNILNLLNDNGFLFLEIGIHQAKSVIDIFTTQGLTHIKTHKDLSGIERILTFQKKNCIASNVVCFVVFPCF